MNALKDTRNIIDAMKGLDEDRIRLLYSNKAHAFAACVVNILGGLNMGIVVRNSNFFGAKEVFYVGQKHWNRISAVGVYKYLTVKHLPDYDALRKLKSRYYFVGVENNIPNKKHSVYNYIPRPNSLYIFGEEGTGLDNEILSMCDDIIYVPGNGTVRSLNVSVCCGIVLSEHIKRSKTLKYKLVNALRSRHGY